MCIVLCVWCVCVFACWNIYTYTFLWQNENSFTRKFRQQTLNRLKHLKQCQIYLGRNFTTMNFLNKSGRCCACALCLCMYGRVQGPRARPKIDDRSHFSMNYSLDFRRRRSKTEQQKKKEDDGVQNKKKHNISRENTHRQTNWRSVSICESKRATNFAAITKKNKNAVHEKWWQKKSTSTSTRAREFGLKTGRETFIKIFADTSHDGATRETWTRACKPERGLSSANQTEMRIFWLLIRNVSLFLVWCLSSSQHKHMYSTHNHNSHRQTDRQRQTVNYGVCVCVCRCDFRLKSSSVFMAKSDQKLSSSSKTKYSLHEPETGFRKQPKISVKMSRTKNGSAASRKEGGRKVKS